MWLTHPLFLFFSFLFDRMWAIKFWWHIYKENFCFHVCSLLSPLHTAAVAAADALLASHHSSLSLSLSHCCPLSLIVPHFFSMVSLAASNRSYFFFCFFMCFTSSVFRSFIASVFFLFSFATSASHLCLCVCVCVFWFFICVLSFSLPGEELCCCVLWLERSLQQEEWHEGTREESLSSLWWWLVLRLSSCCAWLSYKGFCSLESFCFSFFWVLWEWWTNKSLLSCSISYCCWCLVHVRTRWRCENLLSFEFREAGDPAELCLGSREREREREA